MADERTEKQKVQEITDKLEEGLKELFESEKYKTYLSTMSKFHNYSFNNTLLIAMQKPEFCGLTLKDIDMQNKTINVDHQLQYVGNKGKYIEKTKTDAGTRVLPMSEEVYEVMKRVLVNRKKPKIEICIDGYTGFLFLDKRGMPMMPYQWEKRFQRSVEKYNKIYRVQLPKITPHVCRHTFCTNMAKRGISVETLKYLMGHTDISVTLNVYTHLKLEDAEKEIKRLENVEKELKRCAR